MVRDPILRCAKIGFWTLPVYIYIYIYVYNRINQINQIHRIHRINQMNRDVRINQNTYQNPLQARCYGLRIRFLIFENDLKTFKWLYFVILSSWSWSIEAWSGQSMRKCHHYGVLGIHETSWYVICTWLCPSQNGGARSYVNYQSKCFMCPQNTIVIELWTPFCRFAYTKPLLFRVANLNGGHKGFEG